MVWTCTGIQSRVRGIQELYEVGLGLIQEFRFRGNEVPQYGVLQLVNQPQGNGKSDQNLGYNAAWYGVLGSGLLEPTLQVGFFPRKVKSQLILVVI